MLSSWEGRRGKESMVRALWGFSLRSSVRWASPAWVSAERMLERKGMRNRGGGPESKQLKARSTFSGLKRFVRNQLPSETVSIASFKKLWATAFYHMIFLHLLRWSHFKSSIMSLIILMSSWMLNQSSIPVISPIYSLKEKQTYYRIWIFVPMSRGNILAWKVF